MASRWTHLALLLAACRGASGARQRSPADAGIEAPDLAVAPPPDARAQPRDTTPVSALDSAAPAFDADAAGAGPDRRRADAFENSLGMRFAPLRGAR
jgi:hypothetical protein